ncbi:MAG: hypothetical protein DLM61_02235 [Pseudonocardiales bacterium]|nr:MAG: hypothetical protein DLM61_02235 [Pseudonocardiales bacterium]
MTAADHDAAKIRSTHRIQLHPTIPEAKADEFAKRLFFVSEAILDFSLIRGGGLIGAVDLVLAGAADLDQLSKKLTFMVANDVLAQRQVEHNVVWTADADRLARDVFDELLAGGVASEAGEGQIAIGEPVLSLMDYLDARILELVRSEFGAREFRYPTLISTAAMDRCCYFRSFPHLMMFVSRLHGDVDTYRGFLDDLTDRSDLSGSLRSYCGDFDYCLPPTMCFHTYHQLADRPLREPSMVVTARGKSFRFESRYRRSLERLWDFTIREVVFLGSRDLVLGRRSRLMELTYELVTDLGLGGRCEVANDPFFVDGGTADRVWSQQILRLKYELRLPLEPGRDVAVCSFNFHEQFFSDSYRIESADGTSPVYTACAGYGLERLAFAFLCQHGLDPANWPAPVRRAVIG